MGGGTTVKPERVWSLLMDGERIGHTYSSKRDAQHWAGVVSGTGRTVQIREYLMVPVVDGVPWLAEVPERWLANADWLRGGPKE